MNTDDILFTIRVPYENDRKFYRIQTKWDATSFTLSVLENDNAYFSNISFDQLKVFAAKYDENYESYYAKIHSCFIENCADTILYNLKNNELILSHKGILTKQFANFSMIQSSFSQIALELIDELFHLNTSYKTRVTHCHNEMEKAETEKNIYVSKLDNYVNEKANMEHELYSKFIMILNEKKSRIQDLRDMLECNKNGGGFSESEGNSEIEINVKPVQKVKKRLEILSDSESSNTDVELGEKITHQVQNDHNDSQKNLLDFLDDDCDDLQPLTSLPKRIKISNETDNIKIDNNLDYLEKDTIEIVASTSGSKNNEQNVNSNQVEPIINGENSQDSVDFNTQDLFDRL